jgi:alkylation response protein AidB-like acyl-CoA dehydrogenase
VLRDLGEIGALGLYVDEQYGGQGLSQTGYARVFETVGQIDATWRSSASTSRSASRASPVRHG